MFTEDLSGTVFIVAELAVYEAEEVREELGQDDDGTPAFGRWIPAEIDGDIHWLAAPGELIEELQRIDPEVGDVIEVTRCVKSGDRQTDPYEVNLSVKSDGQQTGLPGV